MVRILNTMLITRKILWLKLWIFWSIIFGCQTRDLRIRLTLYDNRVPFNKETSPEYTLNVVIYEVETQEKLDHKKSHDDYNKLTNLATNTINLDTREIPPEKVESTFIEKLGKWISYDYWFGPKGKLCKNLFVSTGTSPKENKKQRFSPTLGSDSEDDESFAPKNVLNSPRRHQTQPNSEIYTVTESQQSGERVVEHVAPQRQPLELDDLRQQSAPQTQPTAFKKENTVENLAPRRQALELNDQQQQSAPQTRPTESKQKAADKPVYKKDPFGKSTKSKHNEISVVNANAKITEIPNAKKTEYSLQICSMSNCSPKEMCGCGAKTGITGCGCIFCGCCGACLSAGCFLSFFQKLCTKKT